MVSRVKREIPDQQDQLELQVLLVIPVGQETRVTLVHQASQVRQAYREMLDSQEQLEQQVLKV
jgi:hypothetical protein